MVCLWRLDPGRPLRCINRGKTGEDRVSALSFSAHDRWLAAGQLGGDVQLLRTDGTQSEPGCRLEAPADTPALARSITALLFTARGGLVALGASNGSVRSCPQALEEPEGSAPAPFWGPATLPLLKQFPNSSFTHAAPDASGRLLAVATSDGLGVWSLRDGAKHWLRQPLHSLITALVMSTDGRTLATGHLDGSLRLWEVASGRARRLASQHQLPVRALALSTDGTQLAAGAEDRRISIWDVASDPHRWYLSRSAPIDALAFRPDGSALASADEDAGITLWDAATGKVVQELSGNADGIQSVAFGPKGELLATASDDHQVRIWKREPDGQGGVRWRLACGSGPLSGGVVHAVAFEPVHGQTAAIASESPFVQFLRVDGCRLDGAGLPSAGAWVKSLAYSRDGKLLATGTDSGVVEVWDAEDRRRLRVLTAHKDTVSALAFSPTEDRVLVTAAMDKFVRVWDLASGKTLRALPVQDSGIKALAVSPDGKLVALSAAGGVSLWELGSGAAHSRLPDKQPVSALRFSPDSRQIFTAGSDGTVQLWAVADPQPQPPVLTFAPERGGVQALDLSASNGTLAAAAWGEVIVTTAGDLSAGPPEPREEVHLVQGRQGWAAWTPGGRLYRRETGGLLLTEDAQTGELAARPLQLPGQPARLEFSTAFEDAAGGGPSLGQLIVRVHNLDPARPVYWLRPEASELPGRTDLGAELNLILPPLTLWLDPGRSIALPIGVALRRPALLPPREVRFCLRLRHAQVGGVPGLGSHRGEEPCAGPLAREVSFALGPWWWRHRTAVLLGGLGGLCLAAAGLVLRWRRRRRQALDHPLVRAALSGQNPLKELGFVELPEADRVLRAAERYRGGLLSRALGDAGIDEYGWQRALSAFGSHARCVGALAESLHAVRGALPPTPIFQSPDVSVFKLALPPLPINVPGEVLVVICTAVTLAPQTVVIRCLPSDLKWPRFTFLIDRTAGRTAERPAERPAGRTTSGADPAWIKQTLQDAYPSTVFVVLQDAELQRILLAANSLQAQDALREAIVGQCALRQIIPYRRGGSEIPPEDACFFGRKQELELMLDQQRQNFFLVGPRFMGKSSLLNALSRELHRRCPEVRVTKYQFADDSLGPIRLTNPGLRADSPEGFYESVLARSTEHQIFLLDEADAFIRSEGQSGSCFCSVMRALSGMGRASFVLAGYRQLEEASMGPEHPLRNFGEVLRLEPLDGASAERMIREPFDAMGLRFAEPTSTVDWLREQTGCRPHLLALVCSAIASLRKPLSRSAISFREVREEVLSYRNLRIAFGEWDNGVVAPLDRAIVRAALLLDHPSQAALLRLLGHKGLVLGAEELEKSLRRLYAQHYVLIAHSEGRLRCPVELFRFFLSDPRPELAGARQWSSGRERLEAELDADIAAVVSPPGPAADSGESALASP